MLDKAYLQNLNLREEDGLDCICWCRSQHIFRRFLRRLVLASSHTPNSHLCKDNLGEGIFKSIVDKSSSSLTVPPKKI